MRIRSISAVVLIATILLAASILSPISAANIIATKTFQSGADGFSSSDGWSRVSSSSDPSSCNPSGVNYYWWTTKTGTLNYDTAFTTKGYYNLVLTFDSRCTSPGSFKVEVKQGGTWTNKGSFSGTSWGTRTVNLSATVPNDGLRFVGTGSSYARVDCVSLTGDLDNTPPNAFTPTANPAGWTNGNVSVTFSTTDSNTYIDHYEVAVDGGAYSTASSPYTMTQAGQHTVNVKAVDAAGNATVGSVTTKIDRTAPNPGTAISPAFASSSPIVVSYSGAGDTGGSGFHWTWLWYKKGVDGTWTSTGLYSTSTSDSFNFVPPDGEGTYYFTLRAADNAENTSTHPSLKGNGDTSTVYDQTAPSTPVVTDDGEQTTVTTELHATWTSSDSGSGVVEYQYAISADQTESGIIPGGEWQSVGTAEEATRTGILLTYGETYYILVKAKNGAGMWSEIGVSDGIFIFNDLVEVYPVGMSNLAVGGGDWHYTQGSSAGQRGVFGAVGLNTLGMLIRTWGVITIEDASTFSIEDGSGVRVICTVPSGVTLNPNWNFVIVTGISTCSEEDGKIIRKIRVRDENDIIPLN